MANSAQQIDVLGAVEAPTAATLHRPDLVKTALPESQHVLRNFKFHRDFADGAECARCLVHAASYPKSLQFFGIMLSTPRAAT
jgi:hypothetical protein